MRKILILGGSSDIGKTLITKFLINGNHVTAHFNKNNQYLKLIKNKNFKKVQLDFSKINDKLCNKILNKKFKNHYDIIINCVGYIDKKSYENTDLQSIINTIKINALIPSMLVKLKVKKMLEKKWGRILNCSSIGVKFGGGAKTYNYSLSKHVSEFLPRNYKNWIKKNVMINNLRIGLTNTQIHKKLGRDKKTMIKRVGLIPIKRMATTNEISNYIIDLVSEENSYMSGQTITISGGE